MTDLSVYVQPPSLPISWARVTLSRYKCRVWRYLLGDKLKSASSKILVHFQQTRCHFLGKIQGFRAFLCQSLGFILPEWWSSSCSKEPGVIHPSAHRCRLYVSLGYKYPCMLKQGRSCAAQKNPIRRIGILSNC